MHIDSYILSAVIIVINIMQHCLVTVARIENCHSERFDYCGTAMAVLNVEEICKFAQQRNCGSKCKLRAGLRWQVF